MVSTGEMLMLWQADDSDSKVDMSGWRKPRMVLAYSDDGKPRPLRWLWPGQIPFGALTFFDGEEGWIHSPAIELIGHVTNEQGEASGTLGLGGLPLVLTLEHDPDEVNAALNAAHVNLRRMQLWSRTPVWDAESQGWTTNDYELPEDFALLEKVLRTYDFSLLIIDHLGEVLDPEFYYAKYQKVRAGLTPLARLAGQLNLVVLILRCTDTQFPVPSRGWGSGNIPRRSVPRIRWVGDSRYTEYERIIAESGFGLYERERLDIWLRNELAAGPVPMKELEWLAADEGWTPKQLRSAKKRLGVISHRQGFGEDGFSLWSLNWKRVSRP